MKIIAVDDEALSLDILSGLIKVAEESAELCSFRDAESALEHLKKESCDVAFLDIELGEMSGVDLAREIKILYPHTNIIFTTAHSKYAGEALSLHASGYILKPVSLEQIRKELDDLRYPLAETKPAESRVRIQCFGDFEIYVDDTPVKFKYRKTKELLAYLVDRSGAMCSNADIMKSLWEDEEDHTAYLKSLLRDLSFTFKALGCEELLIRQWGGIAVRTGCFECDYYNWKKGFAEGINAYHGEYMNQYNWSEFTARQSRLA